MATRLERLNVALELLEDTALESDRAQREIEESIRHLKHAIRLGTRRLAEVIPENLCNFCGYCPEEPQNFEYELHGEATRLSFCGLQCKTFFESSMSDMQIATRQEV